MAAGPRLLLLQTVIRPWIIPAASNGLVPGLMWCHNITTALFAPSLIAVEAQCSQAPGYQWRSVCTFQEQIGYSNGKSMNILKYFWLRDSEEHFIPFYFTLMSWKCSKNWNYKSVQEILALLLGNTLDRESSSARQDCRLETEHLCVSRPHWQWPALGGWKWWRWWVHWSGRETPLDSILRFNMRDSSSSIQQLNTSTLHSSIRHISTLNSDYPTCINID